MVCIIVPPLHCLPKLSCQTQFSICVFQVSLDLCLFVSMLITMSDLMYLFTFGLFYIYTTNPLTPKAVQSQVNHNKYQQAPPNECLVGAEMYRVKKVCVNDNIKLLYVAMCSCANVSISLDVCLYIHIYCLPDHM